MFLSVHDMPDSHMTCILSHDLNTIMSHDQQVIAYFSLQPKTEQYSLALIPSRGSPPSFTLVFIP